MPIVFFLQFCWKISAQLGRVRILCAIYSFQFISIQFISILFYSIQRDENYETLRMITKKTKKTKITKITKKRKITKYYEILRKKGNTLIKNHVIVIFYAKSVYFFIHLKNVFIAFFLFFRQFSFFSFVFLFFVNFVFIRYL